MIELKSFHESLTSVQLRGTLFFKANELNVEFCLQDPLHQVMKVGPLKKVLHRQNDLWKSTCFELFLSELGEKSYWELNFSVDGAWNLYRFDEYRRPQPPKESLDFQLIDLQWEFSKLKIRLKIPDHLKALEACLCSVIQLQSNELHYFSSYHVDSRSARPDFHRRENFTIPLVCT